MPGTRIETRPVRAADSRPAIGGDGRDRVAIESIEPQVDGGRFPVKRIQGDKVEVAADVLADGHDAVAARVLFRTKGETDWSSAPMQPLVNDRWVGEFTVAEIGDVEFTVEGWIDHFTTWKRDLEKRAAVDQNLSAEFLIAADMIAAAAAKAPAREQLELEEYEDAFRSRADAQEKLQLAREEKLARLMDHWAPRFATHAEPALKIAVDRAKAAFSAWYEMFPRSAASEPRHGTLRDAEARLPYVASMGFDVLYLPPIHPIGRAFRKGRNNSTTAEAMDVGSPWAIGSEAGGHKSIDPQLGTLEDFRRLISSAERLGIELALDIALQCSPDHPYVRDHPEWFRRRPDGTIQYAENPPKKYQDIFPFDFETREWRSLWHELRSIFLFWIDQGVRIFRVDNPHTKPFCFWDWVIAEIRRDYPETIFLAEAFTRPKIMHRLAKGGFTQSYTYFAWRDSKWELEQYLAELTRTTVCNFFRPNLWPNTPDILPESLQVGGRAAFMARLVLAATLSGNYGIYGPPFEHAWSAPREPGSEEYLHSEKYEVHHHDVARPDSLRHFIARVNSIRKQSAAFANASSLTFHRTDNDQIIAYSRADAAGDDLMLMAVNLDYRHRQSAWIELTPEVREIPSSRPYQMHDLLTDARYLWHGNRNYVELDPQVCPAHIFRIRQKSRSERDFEYYL